MAFTRHLDRFALPTPFCGNLGMLPHLDRPPCIVIFSPIPLAIISSNRVLRRPSSTRPSRPGWPFLRSSGISGMPRCRRDGPSQIPSFPANAPRRQLIWLPAPEVNPSLISRSISRHLPDFFSCSALEIWLLLSNAADVMDKAKRRWRRFVTDIWVG